MKYYHILLIIIALISILISISIIIQIDNPDDSKWSKQEIIILENNSKSYRQNLIVDKSDTIHIAWKGKTKINNYFNIYYKNKKSNQNWSNNQIITQEEKKESHCISMIIDQYNTVHIAWLDEADHLNSGEDKDIFYRYMPLNKNWSKIELISKESTNDCNCPSMSIKKNRINIIWPDKNTDIYNNIDVDIYYKNKNINENNWSELELISIDSISDSLVCEIEEDNMGDIHVVWQEKNPNEYGENNYGIYYSKKDKYNNWTKKELISSNNDGNSVSPSIEIDSENTIHIIWIDNTNQLNSGSDYDVYYRYKKHNNIWSKIELISKESKENCNWPYIKIDANDNIHVAWSDKTNYSNGDDYDIIYAKKGKNGIWHPIEIVSTESKNNSNWPRFDIDSKGKVHMSWWDDKNNNWIIYYKNRSI